MRECYQFQGQSILEHGIVVAVWFADLYQHLQLGEPLAYAWRLPTWFNPENRQLFRDNLPPGELLGRYQRYHDCGKPFCRMVDERGRQHFPNHAEASYQRWLECGGDAETAALIRQDMDVHLLKAEDIAAFATRPQAIALLLTGLAEVHANAQMFGGLESDSFKIKLKHLERRGRQIIVHIKQKE